ncbi:MAG: hypothetical protein DLM58_24585 [Pseudonocardiales bacterium]|nr:MAG: hypothetical protein DLM58_24585 [Pseudonocardiales bacterium]
MGTVSGRLLGFVLPQDVQPILKRGKRFTKLLEDRVLLLQQGGRRGVGAEGLKVGPELRDVEEDVCFVGQQLDVFTDGAEDIVGKPGTVDQATELSPGHIPQPRYSLIYRLLRTAPELWRQHRETLADLVLLESSEAESFLTALTEHTGALFLLVGFGGSCALELPSWA